MKFARDPDSKTVAVKIVDQIVKAGIVRKKLTVETVFTSTSEPLGSPFWALAKVGVY